MKYDSETFPDRHPQSDSTVFHACQTTVGYSNPSLIASVVPNAEFVESLEKLRQKRIETGLGPGNSPPILSRVFIGKPDVDRETKLAG